MTSNRPYAVAVTREQALRELFRYAGMQFDPAVVEAFAAVQADLSTELVA
jgi:response regulator RpfG family c-di-GMP phosphodiesterase